jgi:hypothetical protein
MKKIILGVGFLALRLLFAQSYEVTNVACDEKLSIRIKPDVESNTFHEIYCNQKNIELIKCSESNNTYQWCKIRYKFYENILTGWVYSKYITKMIPETEYEKEYAIERLIKSAKAYYYGTKKVGKNYDKAKKAFLKASKKGSLVAYRYLGTMYLFGHGTDVDKEEAKKWLMKAVDLGDENAKKVYTKYFLHL